MPSLPDTYHERVLALLARAREANSAPIAALAPIIGRSIAEIAKKPDVRPPG